MSQNLSITSLSQLNQNSTSLNLIITAYAPKLKTAIAFEGAGRTKQSFKSECDINQIMARYIKTGTLDFAQKHAPQYGDVRGIDFERGLTIVRQAQSMFAELPARVRARFGNDPAEFLHFVQDPETLDEQRELGLLRPEVKVATPEPGIAAAGATGVQGAPVAASEGIKAPDSKKAE